MFSLCFRLSRGPVFGFFAGRADFSPLDAEVAKTREKTCKTTSQNALKNEHSRSRERRNRPNPMSPEILHAHAFCALKIQPASLSLRKKGFGERTKFITFLKNYLAQDLQAISLECVRIPSRGTKLRSAARSWARSCCREELCEGGHKQGQAAAGKGGTCS